MSSIRSALALRRGLVAARTVAPATVAAPRMPFARTAPRYWFPNPGASKPKATPTPTPTPEAEPVVEQPVEKPTTLIPDHSEPTPEPTVVDTAALDAANKLNAQLQLDLDVLKKRLTDTEEKISTLHESIQDWEHVALRERADAENARRIAKEDVKAANVYAIKSFAKDLLEIPDTFASAIMHAKKSGLAEDAAGKKFMDGIEAVERVLMRALERHGVRRQEVKPGETIFDPEQHEALSLIPTEGDTYHHTVLDVFQPGYVLSNRVLRAAKVVVADNPSKPPPVVEKAQ